MLANTKSAHTMEINTVDHVIKYTFYAQYFDFFKSPESLLAAHALFNILFSRFPNDSYSWNETTCGPSAYNKSYASSVKVL